MRKTFLQFITIITLTLLLCITFSCQKQAEEVAKPSLEQTKIAFFSDRARAGNGEIYVMNADGSEQTNITNNPAFDARPSWSPDGKKIAFQLDVEGYLENFEIYVMNADGSEQTNITNNPAEDSFPSWSPFLKTRK